VGGDTRDQDVDPEPEPVVLVTGRRCLPERRRHGILLGGRLAEERAYGAVPVVVGGAVGGRGSLSGASYARTTPRVTGRGRRAEVLPGPCGSDRLHLQVLGLEIEDTRRLGHGQAVVLLHQPGDERFELTDPDAELTVLGGQPEREAAVLLEMAHQSLGHG
jgi:hypothetical protein